MSKAAAGIRRSLGLDKELHARLAKKSALLRASENEYDIPSAPPGFHPSKCLLYGLCVCGKRKNAEHMFDSCKRLLRSLLAKKKNQDLTPLRIALDAGLLVLQFSRPVAPEGQALADMDDEWSAAYTAAGFPASTAPEHVWVHVGRLNLQNYHFGALRLDVVFPQPDDLPPGVVHLRPIARQEHEERIVVSDLQLFAELLDLNVPWVLTFHTISTVPAHWQGASIETVVTCQAADQPPIRLWQGSAEEQNRRKILEAPRRQKQRGKRGAAGPRAAQPRRAKVRRAGAAIKRRQPSPNEQAEDRAEDPDLAADDDEDDAGLDLDASNSSDGVLYNSGSDIGDCDEDNESESAQQETAGEETAVQDAEDFRLKSLKCVCVCMCLCSCSLEIVHSNSKCEHSP